MVDTWPLLTWPTQHLLLYLGPCRDERLGASNEYTCYFDINSDFIVYIDPSTHLPTMMRDVSILSNPIVFIFNEYRKRGSVNIPFVEIAEGLGRKSETRLLSMDVDVAIPDSVFQPMNP
jgi:hypothetical protein